MKRSRAVNLTIIGAIAASVLLGGCDDTYDTYQYQGCTNSAGIAVDPSMCRSSSPGFVWYYAPNPIIVGVHPFGGGYSRTVINNNHWYGSGTGSHDSVHSSSNGSSFKGASASPVSRGGFGSTGSGFGSGS